MTGRGRGNPKATQPENCQPPTLVTHTQKNVTVWPVTTTPFFRVVTRTNLCQTDMESLVGHCAGANNFANGVSPEQLDRFSKGLFGVKQEQGLSSLKQEQGLSSLKQERGLSSLKQKQDLSKH